MGLQSFDEVTPIFFSATWTPGLGTGVNNLSSSLANVWRADAFTATSTDTIDHLCQVWLNSVLIDTINIPAGAGNGAVPPVNMMAKLLADVGMDHIVLPVGKTIQVGLVVGLAAGKVIYFFTSGGIVPSL
jgi:hypothetical protein